MNEFKLKMGLEPTDQYDKAKESLIEALNDFSKLDKQQQANLLGEFISAEALKAIYESLQQLHFG